MTHRKDGNLVFKMETRSIVINNQTYDALSLVQEIITNQTEWRINGLEFLIQLIDTSPIPVKFYTSGTTGIPKEIFFTKDQIFTSAMNTCKYFNIKKEGNLLLCLPAEFVAGRLMFARAMVSGGNLIWVQPSLNPLQNTGNIDFAAFTPAQVSTIIKDPVTRNKFKTIRTVIIGGGEVSMELENELKHFDNNIYSTYGMTETLTHVAVRKIGELEFKWIHGLGGLSKNENNCLVIDLPFISDEPIVTKDIVDLIDEHTFIWKGRLDNVINSGGKKLFAEDIEKKIYSANIMSADEFYITSAKDAVFGEVPVIVIQNGVSLPPLDQVNSVLKKYEHIKHIEIIDKFEYTPTGKIKRLKF